MAKLYNRTALEAMRQRDKIEMHLRTVNFIEHPSPFNQKALEMAMRDFQRTKLNARPELRSELRSDTMAPTGKFYFI